MNDENNQNNFNGDQTPSAAPQPVNAEPELQRPVTPGTSFAPASSDFAPAEQPQVPQIAPQPTQKKSKKGLVMILVLLLLIGAAAAYYFLVISKKEEPSNSQASSQTSEEKIVVDAQFYQTNTQLKYVDISKQTATDDSAIPDGATVLKTSEDGNEIYYASYTDDSSEEEDTTSPVAAKIVKVSNGTETVLLTTSSLNFDDSFYPVLSPDQKQVAYLAFETANDSSDAKKVNLYTANLDGSNKETVIAPGYDEARSYGAPLAWSSDSSSIYLSQKSCYIRCGGYVDTPNVWKITVASKEFKNIFEQPEGTTVGSSVISPDGSKIAVSATSLSKVMPKYAEVKDATFDVYLVSVVDDSSDKIYSEIKENSRGAESFQYVAGWSTDSAQLIIGVPLAAENSSAGLGYDEIFDRFDLVAAADGKVTAVPIDITTTANFVFSATMQSNSLYFVGEDKNTTDEQASNELTATQYSLYSLSLEGDEAEIKTIETSLPKLHLLGAGKITQSD